jgi:hypothetical protein
MDPIIDPLSTQHVLTFNSLSIVSSIHPPSPPGRGLNKTQQLAQIEQLFHTPEPFIAAMKADIVARKHFGVNFDLEPWFGHNTSIAWPMQHRYADFLTLVSRELESVGAVVTADLGSTPSYGGNGMYTNISVFGAVPLHPGITMSTYQLGLNFSGHIADAIAAFGPARTGIGLCDGCHNVNVTQSVVDGAFKTISAAGVTELDWFALVVRGTTVVDEPGALWLPHLRAFLAS